MGLAAFIGVPAAVGFLVAFAVVRRVGDLGTGLAVLAFPVGLALAAYVAKHAIWDPDAGCSEECWGVLVYGAWWLSASIGAELGVIVGTATKWVRARPRRARDPQAS